MKFRKTKKALAAVLTVSMGIGLCGCGGDTSVGNNGEAQRYFKTTYVENVPDTFNGNMSGNSLFKGDTFYYGAYNDDYTKNGVYSFNLLTGETQTIWENEENPDDELRESSYVNSYTVDDDGNIYMYINHNQIDPASLEKDYSSTTLDDVIDYMVSNWGYDEDMAREDWDAWYAGEYTDEDGNIDYGKFMKDMASEWIYTYYLQKIDKEGNVVYEYDITGDDASGDSYCYGIAVDKDGYLYAYMNEWDETSDIYYVIVIDENGNVKGQIDFDGYASGVFTLGDGRVAACGWGDTGAELSIFDGQSLKVAETLQIDGLNSPMALDETHLLYSDGTALYSYNLEDESVEKYFSWVECNISSSSVQSYGVLSDGSIGVFTQTWRNSDGMSICDLAIVNEVDKSEVGDVTYINIACLWSDSSVEEKAIEFNKKHDDYRITITPYYTDGVVDYEDAVNSFTTAIASDTSVDIVMFNDYSQVVNFAAKGLLTDMYDLIDNDPDLTREDFLQNVLSACEYDGQLVMLPTTFSISTVVGKTEDVGTEPGWTFDEMQSLLASKPEGTELFYGMTRDWALNICLSLGYNDFIDWENGSCSFNSDEFVNVLEFANMFPEEYEWSDEVDETVLMNTGKVLLSQYYLSDFEQIQMYREIFAGDLTYIGYPTTEGNGAMLELTNMFGITKNCDSNEVAWEFLREFYMPREDSDNYYYYGFSVRQDDFDKFCEEAMEEDEYGGGTSGWGSFEIEIKPATQEDVDAVKELVAGTTAISGAVSSDILNIIEEEAAAYFAGEKTAEDVASIIQSRMEIYLNETK